MTNREHCVHMMAQRRTTIEELRIELAEVMAQDHTDRSFQRARALEGFIREAIDANKVLTNMIHQADLA